MAETYRSYVVRVRRPAIDVEAVQIDVEDLIGGRRVAVNGDEARVLADRLRSLVIGPTAGPSTGRRTSPRGGG